MSLITPDNSSSVTIYLAYKGYTSQFVIITYTDTDHCKQLPNLFLTIIC